MIGEILKTTHSYSNKRKRITTGARIVAIKDISLTL